MSHLRQELAPVLPAAWSMIEEEARGALKGYLAARKLVDFDGPHGWGHSAVNLGRAEAIEFPHGGTPKVAARRRTVLPMVELRVDFELSRAALDDVERGATDIDLDAVVQAARSLSHAEDGMALYGVVDLGIEGMVSGSSQPKVALSGDAAELVKAVSVAIAQLRAAAVEGPYALALEADLYSQMLQTTGPGGYPVVQHLKRLVDGPVVWAPALSGGLLASMRGGDFQLIVGQDVSVGYAGHTQDTVHLYLEESVSFRLTGPEAVVALQK